MNTIVQYNIIECIIKADMFEPIYQMDLIRTVLKIKGKEN